MKAVYFYLLTLLALFGCKSSLQDVNSSFEKINIIIDTDANNELDDQQALAKAFANQDFFQILGVTVNSTRVGNGIEGHYAEAVRIAKLMQVEEDIPILKGAENTFEEIYPEIESADYDGKEAVDFILQESRKPGKEKIKIVALGKLTNVALALAVDPSLKDRAKLIWLGTNYPDPGEYNLENDTSCLNFVLHSGIETDIVLVAYGRKDGTDAVKVPIAEVKEKIPGLGPVISDSIEGRNGGYFNNFGDYALNLWENIELFGPDKSRSLFDLAALVILKKPDYAEKKSIKTPYWKSGGWVTPDTTNSYSKLVINFEADSILNEFYSSFN